MITPFPEYKYIYIHNKKLSFNKNLKLYCVQELHLERKANGLLYGTSQIYFELMSTEVLRLQWMLKWMIHILDLLFHSKNITLDNIFLIHQKLSRLVSAKP